MSSLSRLARIAKKAISTAQLQSGSNSGSNSGSGDWRSMVRSAADAITGDGRSQQQGYDSRGGDSRNYDDRSSYGARNRSEDYRSSTRRDAGTPEDRQAVARYDYLMRTADPDQIERVHQEAFARLSPTQRLLVQERMNEELPEHERPRSSEPNDLARSAARSEASHPGKLQGLLARVGGGSGGGGRGAMLGGAAAGAGIGMAAGVILTAVAGGAILSSVAGPLLANAMSMGVDFDQLANGVDLESLASGADFEGVGGSFADAGNEWVGEATSGFGDVANGLGDFTLPGLDDLFGR